MRELLSVTLLTIACLAVGCASSTLYRPAPEPEDYGYRDLELTADRYRVSFAGNYLTSRETVETYLLYRAAEITLAAGYQHFRLLSRDTEAGTEYHATTSGTGSVGWGYVSHGTFFGTGIGVTSARPSTRYRAVAEILVGQEVGPEGPDVYDARELKERLESRVARPLPEG